MQSLSHDAVNFDCSYCPFCSKECGPEFYQKQNNKKFICYCGAEIWLYEESIKIYLLNDKRLSVHSIKFKNKTFIYDHEHDSHQYTIPCYIPPMEKDKLMNKIYLYLSLI